MSDVKKSIQRIAVHHQRAWISPCLASRRVARLLSLLLGLIVSLTDACAQENQQPPAAKNDPKAKFEARDTAQDQRLTEAEFLSRMPEDKQRESKRDFLIFDLDGDGTLTYEEFLNIPSLVPRDQRGRLPDPVAGLMEKQFAEIESAWSSWDKNGDGSLDSDEFQASQLTAVPGMRASAWDQWQRDGQLTLPDCRRRLEVAYGIRRKDGQSLRSESGLAVDWTIFQRIDDDADDRIDRKTYLEFEGKRIGQDRAEKIFADTDIDSDGVVTFAEWAASLNRRIDPIAHFLQFDTDLNGKLDRDELIAGARWWRQPQAPYIHKAFDLDRDGLLSLEEYRLTPFANELMRWDLPLNDADKDGRISPSEFLWNPRDELPALTATYFQMLDLNGDGFLGQEELTFKTQKVDTRRVFLARDRNGDERLTEEEYLQPEPDDKRAAAKRDFRVFDFNRDGVLTHEEFLAIPSRVRKEQRGPLPDPVVALLESRLSELQSQWNKWDINGDGGLDREEFTRSGIARTIPGLALTSWEDWSRGGDGRITLDDCRSILEIAYGVRRPDGQLLRMPSGLVVDWTTFQRIDSDTDDRLSEQEYMAFFGAVNRDGPEKAKVDYAAADFNGDKLITFAEWSALPRGWHDHVAGFLGMDKNLDGQLDRNELVSASRWWKEPLAPHVFAAFDEDKDGFLSLVEYRLTPFANELVRWDLRLPDPDNDGRLSPGEFQFSSGITLAGLMADYFRLLDLNRDGHLDLDEFAFNISRTRAPRSAVFKQWDTDRDARLSLKDILSRNAKGSKESDVAYEKKVARIEESFHQANLDGNDWLSLQEFESDAAKGIVSPTSRPAPKVAKSNRSSGVADDEPKSRMWIIVGANVLLIGAVAVFLTRKS
jgi:Ca2+-binding EF-hand superfamily protein